MLSADRLHSHFRPGVPVGKVLGMTASSTTLSHAEEIELARRIEAGLFATHLLEEADVGYQRDLLQVLADQGASAYQRFYLANLAMVHLIAGSWAQRYRLGREELVQEGCIGLGEAIQRFDHRRGFRFSTLAWRLITNRVAVSARSRCGQLDESDWRLRQLTRVHHERGRLEQAGSRSTTDLVEELSASLDRPRAWVTDLLSWSAPAPLEVIADLPGPVVEELEGGLVDALRGLEREVVLRRYGWRGEPMSVAGVAGQLGVSRSAVRAAEQQALRRLRAMLAEVQAC